MSQPTQLGVIGGSGVYNIKGVTVTREHDLNTPFGKPSDPVIEADVAGKKVFFVPRHGKGHRLLPTEVNYRANIFALKSLGVTHVVSVSAVGIMQEHIKPGDMIVPDQIYDRTKGIRPSTFFGEGLVGHVAFADPFCEEMRAVIINAAKSCTDNVHVGGAIVVMEGPQFSTRAESLHYRKTLSPACIGMTALPEAKLAREAEISYALLATATDYDCWKEDEEDVSVEAVVAVVKGNAELASSIVQKISDVLPEVSNAASLSAAQYCIMTAPEAIPTQTKEKLATLYGKYFR